jgi:polygalacturonase
MTIYNVHDFGAVGNGITDDTAAIQAAYDYANKGDKIDFPHGTYLISGPIILNRGENS